jgi:RNA polymerase sigma-70 factor, ECF subfamily
MEAPLQNGKAEQAELVKQTQDGDHTAFAQLYTLHKRRVHSICLRMVGDVAVAEELTQEVFLQLHRKIETFRGESEFTTWLHRLTVNLVWMWLRAPKNRRNYSIEQLLEARDFAIRQRLTVTDRQLVSTIDRLAVQQALRQLPPGYRTVLTLHDIEGLEHNEIAEILGITIGSSKSQLHRGRRAMIEALGVKISPLSILSGFDRFLSDAGDQQQKEA